MIKKCSTCNACGKCKKTESNISLRHILAKLYQASQKASVTLTAIKIMEFAILCTPFSPQFERTFHEIVSFLTLMNKIQPLLLCIYTRLVSIKSMQTLKKQFQWHANIE